MKTVLLLGMVLGGSLYTYAVDDKNDSNLNSICEDLYAAIKKALADHYPSCLQVFIIIIIIYSIYIINIVQ